MLKCILVPDTISVEYKYLFCFIVSEDQVGVESSECPEQSAWNLLWFNLLEVFNVHDDAFNHSKSVAFVENYLLSVWEQFCMEGEKLHGGNLSW